VDATVTFDLVGPRWGRPDVALPSGDYRLVVGADPETARIEIAGDLPDHRRPLYRARLRDDGGGVVLGLAAPLADGETRPVPHHNGRQLLLRRVQVENAVYFESFYGRTAADNPAAIDAELARRAPGVRRYWSVADGSVPIPPGAVRLIEGSSEWWRVRAEARLYVINDWLRWAFIPRPHQRVLQTWHGTMLKRLALDRPGVTPRVRFAATRQSRRWDALLAQNAYSASIFRTAYAVRRPIWVTGYPRNDILFRPAEVARIRAALGLADGARAVLYAPTWRDDRTELVADLDAVRFARSLSDDHVLLVRGHSRTLGHGADHQGDRLIDVTSYPDVGELMLVADVLITDYSSVMFDFASTGKPMVFFTPDLAHYGDVLRGFYFDLVADAPGPLVQTHDELVAALSDLDGLAAKYADRYAAWQQKFTPHDDGRAAERVVQRLFAEGWLD
jgi:CDP-glycerol glycerophosphotransferase (TagB/SpsB family)